MIVDPVRVGLVGGEAGLDEHPGRQLVGPSVHKRKVRTAAVPTTRPGAQRTVAVRPWRITATIAIGHSASAPAHE